MTIRIILKCQLPKSRNFSNKFFILRIRIGHPRHWQEYENTLFPVISQYLPIQKRMGKFRQFNIGWMSFKPKIAMFFWKQFSKYLDLNEKLRIYEKELNF